jgi:hypothetical protein
MKDCCLAEVVEVERCHGRCLVEVVVVVAVVVVKQ